MEKLGREGNRHKSLRPATWTGGRTKKMARGGGVLDPCAIMEARWMHAVEKGCGGAGVRLRRSGEGRMDGRDDCRAIDL